MIRKNITLLSALLLILSLTACGAGAPASTTEGGSQAQPSASALEAGDQFTDRDLTQEADLSGAIYHDLQDDLDVTITEAGVHVIRGTAENATIIVEAGNQDKVQILLDGVTMENQDFPCIYVKKADKVFVTTTKSENSLTVKGAFTADGTTNTDGVIFSKEDLVLNGLGILTISSPENGVVCKDDLKITGGTLSISSGAHALEANDSIRIADGEISLAAGKDGLHAENDEDETKGYIYILDAVLSVAAGDDGLHGTTIIQIDGGMVAVAAAEGMEATWVQINGGTIGIEAGDDGINAGKKSAAFSPLIEFNGGTTTIKMSAGDTDAVDSNGDLIINGGTIDITAQSAFDYDGTAQYNGGTIIINGTQTDAIPNQTFGGGGKGKQ